MSANPIPSNTRGDFLLDPYLTKFLSEQGKRFPLNQDQSLVYLKRRISFIYGPLNKIWTASEAEKEALSNENSEISPYEENRLITTSYLMDQVILLLGQAINTCAYIRIFNILMSLMRDKKKAEMMLKKMQSHSGTMKKMCSDRFLRRL